VALLQLPGPGTAVFWRLSALRAHAKPPYKMDFHSETLRALNRPWAVRTDAARRPAGVGWLCGDARCSGLISRRRCGSVLGSEAYINMACAPLVSDQTHSRSRPLTRALLAPARAIQLALKNNSTIVYSVLDRACARSDTPPRTAPRPRRRPHAPRSSAASERGSSIKSPRHGLRATRSGLINQSLAYQSTCI
jgi:hypothetical protein